MLLKQFAGLGTALITPFFPNGDINWEALTWLVEKQIADGVKSLVPCGTTGESPTLTHDEQIAVIKFVVKVVASRVSVLAGTGSNCTAEAVELTKRAKKVGADGALVVFPYYNRPTRAGQIKHCQVIAKVGLPIVFYDIPARCGAGMSADTILELAHEGTIIGLKWASGDIAQLTEVLSNCPEDFVILSGHDNRTIELIEKGGHGVISILSNLMPKQMAEFISTSLSDIEASKKMHNELLPCMNAMFLETNPIPVKTALSMVYPEILGMIPSFRLPLIDMEEENREKLYTIILKYRDKGYFS